MTGERGRDLRDVHRRQTPQDVGEIFVRIDSPTSATHDQRVDHRTAPTGARVADEEPAAPADGRNPDRVFDEIVVDLVRSGLEVSGERLVLVEEITDRLTQAALGQ